MMNLGGDTRDRFSRRRYVTDRVDYRGNRGGVSSLI